MSTNALRTAVSAGKEPRSFPELLEQMKPEIARALPKHLNPDRMTRIALTEFRKAPKLGECNLRTVFGAIITLSQLGLEPGVLGQSYLIPYGKDCQGVPGWKGLVDLVARAGRASCWTGAVYEGDQFEYGLGTEPFIRHIPDQSGRLQKVEDLRYCYAVGRVKGAEWPIIEVWSVAKIRAHRDRFNKVGGRHYSFQHFEMYGRKVALLQVIKYLPASVELQAAFDLENAANTGQTIDMSAATDGTWAPPADPEDEPSGSEADLKEQGGAVPQFDAATAAAELRKARSTQQLAASWQVVQKDFVDTKRALPPAVSIVHDEMAEALAEREAMSSEG